MPQIEQPALERLFVMAVLEWTTVRFVASVRSLRRIVNTSQVVVAGIRTMLFRNECCGEERGGERVSENAERLYEPIGLAVLLAYDGDCFVVDDLHASTGLT